MISPIAAWYSRRSAITSSGSELSEKPVKPRKSQNSAVISRRWLSSCLSVPDATIRSATCGGRKRRNHTHALDFADLVSNALFELLIEFDNFLGPLAQFVQKAGILDGDDGLGGEVCCQVDV